MTHTVWIFVAVAAVVILGYFVVMRVFFQESRELDKKIDYSKMKKWQDDE